jgi:hypothetical protein
MARALLVIISFFSCHIVLGQLFPDLVVNRFYDNLGEEVPRRLIPSRDGNLFIGGNSVIPDEMGDNCANIWLLKVDTMGLIIWEHEVRLSGCEELRDLIATRDGGVVFAGVTGSIVNSEEQGDEEYGGNYFVGKVDSVGRLEWIQSYGGSQLDQAFGLSEGLYREYMVVGSTHSDDGQVGQNSGMSDLWTLKIDTKGHTRYSQVLGTPGNDWGTAVDRTQAGDYLIAGYTQTEAEQARNATGQGWLVRLMQSGKLMWDKTLYQPYGSYLADVKETAQGDLILGGYRKSQSGDRDFWWLRAGPTGKVKWEESIEGPDDEQVTCLDLTADGGYILGGYSIPRKGGGAYAKGGEDFWLIRTDSTGRVIWRKTFGGPHHERCLDVVAYRPGVYYAIGEKVNRFTRGESKANQDYWMVRIDEHEQRDINADIFVRADDFRIDRMQPTRFRAICDYGDRFLWDFGDGTTSEQAQPLKTYKISGTYQVTLTVFVNETSQQTVTLEQALEVW